MKVAVRSRPGRYVGAGIGIVLAVLLAACGGGGGGGGGGGNDIAVTLTTQGGATTLTAGDALTIKADVVNTTSNMDVTWTLTGPQCPNSCGTIVRSSTDFALYTAPANATSAFQVMVTATSMENTSKSGSVQLTVNPRQCAANAGLLNGQYAVLLQGFNDVAPNNAIAAAGSLTADGCGSITGGTIDFGASPSASAANATGSYTVGADHRGTVTLTFGGVTKHFAMALGRFSSGASPVSQQGGLTESDVASATTTYNHLSGTMWRRDPTAFSIGGIVGSYAYVLNGWLGSPTGGWSPTWLPSGPRWAVGGTVTVANNGDFSGTQDETVYSTAPITGHAWMGTSALTASTGRLTLSSGGFDALGSAVVYIVNSSQSLVLITDSTSKNVLSGQMLAQSGLPYTQAALQGTFITNQTAHHGGQGFQTMNFGALAIWSADGVSPNGTITTSINDTSSGCNISPSAPASYTYQVAPNGQVTITSGSTLAGKYYLVAKNTGLMLGADPTVSTGGVRPQSATVFDVTAISGSYFATQAPGAAWTSTNASGVATSTGNGTLTSTMDQNNGTFGTIDSVGGTLTATGSGRYQDQRGNALYLVSPTSFLVLNVAPNADCYPVVRVFDQ